MPPNFRLVAKGVRLAIINQKFTPIMESMMSRKKKPPNDQSLRKKLRRTGRRFTDPIFAGKGLSLDSRLLLKRSPFQLIRYVFESSPIQKVNLLGEPFPEQTRSFAQPLPTPCAKNIKSELMWSAASFMRYSSSLNSLLALVRKFETSIILNDLEKAKELLAAIRSSYGISLWFIKMDLLLAEMDTGLKGNRSAKKALAEKSPNLILIFLHFFSHQSEISLSAEEYAQAVEAFCSQETLQGYQNKKLCQYYRFHIGYHFRPDIETHPYILNYSEPLAIIDRYFVWCRLIRFLFEENVLFLDGQISEVIQATSDNINDLDVAFISSLVNPTKILENEIFNSIYILLDLYTRGNYSDAIELAQNLLIQYPFCIELYELAAKSALGANQSFPKIFKNDSLGGGILDAVDAVIHRTDSTQKNLSFLTRTSFRLISSALSAGLEAFVRQHSSDEFPLRLRRRTALAGSVPTPRVFASLGDGEHTKNDLASLLAIDSNNAAIQLFAADQRSLETGFNESLYPQIPVVRQLRHQAYVQEKLEKFKEALSTYQKMEPLVSSHSVHFADMRAGILRCLTRIGQLQDCVRILSESCSTQPNLISGETLRNVIQQYDPENTKTNIGDIGWPIIYGTAQLIDALPTIPDKLHDFLDDFLTAHGFSKPSELLRKSEMFLKAELLFFLREVCTSTVLQSSIWYDSQSEVEQERILICRWLTENDSEFSSRYLEEIAEMSRRAAIRELVHEADRSRIYVDTAGIEIEMPRLIGERALRCYSLFLLRDQELCRSLSVFEGVDSLDLDKFKIIFFDEGLSIFSLIFSEIKELFLGSTHYGLDANLSQRIRHGTLAGEIRARFEDHHLVTYLTANGDYSLPTYWHERLPSLTISQKACLNEAFKELSTSIDAVIAKVRNEWIQLRHTPGKVNALFDYEFSEMELYEKYTELPIGSLEDELEPKTTVIRYIFEILWKRTEENLEKVRDTILTQLRDELFKNLDIFSEKLSAGIGHLECADIRTAVANCRTALGLGLKNISEWFRTSLKQRAPDCRFSDLANAIVNVATKFCGPTQIYCHPHVEDSICVPGNAFRGLWDILLILLDNTAKHSGSPSTNVVLEITQEKNVVELKISNPVEGVSNWEDLRALTSELSNLEIPADDFMATRQEGGSGYKKLHKILRYDLGITDYKIIVNLSPKNEFVVIVTFSTDWKEDETLAH